MKKIFSWLLAILPAAGFNTMAQPLPTPEQRVWATAEIGVLIHYDITLFATKPFDYKKKETLPDLANFHPSQLNTDQWIKAAKEGGAAYAVLVVKHGSGFTLWPSTVNSYHVGNTPWKDGKGDILADFIRSCHKYGVRPGVYYNTNFNTFYEAGYIPFKDTAAQYTYNRAVYAQLKELWTGYGRLFEIWFDGGVMSDEKGGIAGSVAELIKKNQPQAILFQGPVGNKNLVRWVGNEKGRAPYPLWSAADATTSATGAFEIKDLNGHPDGKIWCPGEADFPLRKDSAGLGGFMWNPRSEHLLLSVDELMDAYKTSVGRNANMLLGMVIDTAGLFPAPDAQRMKAFNDRLHKSFDRPLAKTSGNTATLILNLKTTEKVNCIVLMEDIAKGERVRSYHIEAKVNGHWQTAGDGTSIGHKRIQDITPVETSALRLTLTSVAAPRITNFAAYALP